MKLHFHGAAGGVTGSLHRLQVNSSSILLDCGLFQGHRMEAFSLNTHLPPWAVGADALVLSHAHLDHSGNIPTLVKRGFRGNIYCTPATRDLCSVMLRDSAIIQEQDAKYINRRRQNEDDEAAMEPLYTVEDAEAAVNQMISVPMYRPITIADGVKLQFHDSGHVLGSAICQFDLTEHGHHRRLVFTGDLGREELPLLRKPEVVADADLLLMEGTYGDRSHPPYSETDRHLAAAISQTIARGGKVLIPSFALERAQEILFALDELLRRGEIPRVPIYVDSPLAIAITEVYKLHPDALDPAIRERILHRDDPFRPDGLQYVSDYRESQDLQARPEPCIIIAGSGMCEGGRILHHFVKGLGDIRNSVIIVGFQAEHTLGRRLVERRKQVKVLGVERDVLAQIVVVEGLSAHADSRGLVQYAAQTAAVGKLKQIALVHGEPGPLQTLSKRIHDTIPEIPVVIGERGAELEF